MNYTILDITEVIHGGTVEIKGQITREEAIEWASTEGGREELSGPEAGMIRLDETGYLIAVPHDVPHYSED